MRREEILARHDVAVKYLRLGFSDVGIVTGRVSNLCVLVVEDEAAFRAFAAGRTLPVTPTVVTPTSTHFWFCLPENTTIPTCALAPGVELRGEGSFVPVPTRPRDVGGGEYQWALGRSIDDVPLAPLPDWILEQLPPQDPLPPCDLPGSPEGEGDCGHPTNSEGCADDGDGNLSENPTLQKEGREMKFSDLVARFKDIQPGKIPRQMRGLRKWAVYRVEPDEKGRPTKVPYTPPLKDKEDLKKAKCNDPSTWSAFGKAFRAVKLGWFDGLNFVIDGSDDVLAIDVDFKKCPGDEMPEEAKEIFTLFANKTYVEVSPSRRGFHIFLKAKLPADFPDISKFCFPNGVEVEIFCRRHFISVTGWAPEGTPCEVNECQQELDELLQRLNALDRKRKNDAESLLQRLQSTTEAEISEPQVSEDEITALVEKIRRGDFGEKVRDLFEGNWEGYGFKSQSEADESLCVHLARITKGNRDAMDAIFRRSALFRPKWDERRGERTYGQRTIEEALSWYGQRVREGDGKGEGKNESKSESESESKGENKSKGKGDNEAVSLLPEGFVVPVGYIIKPDGLYRVPTEGKEPILIFCYVVYVAERLFLEEMNEERWRLRWKAPDGKWYSTIARPSVCLAARNISALGDLRVWVREGATKLLAQYFYDFVVANADTIPTRRLYTHFGWVESEGQRKFVLDPNEVFEGEEAGLKACGDFEEWRAQVGEWRQRFPIARFVLAAGFATPLLKPLSVRSFIIHIYGKETGGKTAAGKLALSVWGDPDAMLGMWFATRVGLERKASLFANLPILIDELRAEGRNRADFFETVPFLLAGQTSKLRGERGGGLETPKHWCTIFISTGEEALTSFSALGGFRARVLEIYGAPFGDVEEAARVHRFVSQHYGLAGSKFIEKLCQAPTSWLREELHDIFAWLKREDPSLVQSVGAHTLWNISVVALADYLASMWIWGIPEREAKEQAIALALHIARLCAEEGEPKEYWLRCAEDFASEVFRHPDKFPPLREAGLTTTVEVLGAYEIWGVWKEKENLLWIFPTALRDILKRLNYDYKRVLREWEAQGVISKEEGHYTVRRRIGGKVQRVIEIQWDIVAQHLKLQGDSFSAVPGEPREEYPF